MREYTEDIDFSDLYATLGYTFKHSELLKQAFQHASFVNEHNGAALEDNERLEFLGDTVLDLAISHLLMELFPQAPEGELSRYRAMVVDEAGLSQVALKLQLGRYVLLGKGEAQSRGGEKPSILADTMEALLGALYLDAGFPRTLAVIERLFDPVLQKIDTTDRMHDFKSLLQELTQHNYKTLPQYNLVAEQGPAHDKTFQVTLVLNGQILASGEGKSKKEAEQRAAREALLCLQRD
jgi:ribonuclease-3